MKPEKLIGILLIIGSGIIYTIDKGALLIADTIRSSGIKIAADIKGAAGVHFTHMSFEFDNPFGVVFLAAGIIILLFVYFVEFRSSISKRK